MVNIKRSWDLISDDKRRLAVEEIIAYFSRERNEQIGVIAAEALLDFMLETLAIDIYNKGADDTLSFIKKRFESMEPDLAALVKKQG